MEGWVGPDRNEVHDFFPSSPPSRFHKPETHEGPLERGFPKILLPYNLSSKAGYFYE